MRVLRAMVTGAVVVGTVLFLLLVTTVIAGYVAETATRTAGAVVFFFEWLFICASWIAYAVDDW